MTLSCGVLQGEGTEHLATSGFLIALLTLLRCINLAKKSGRENVNLTGFLGFGELPCKWVDL